MPCDSGMSSISYDYEARAQVEKLTRVSCDIMRALEAAGVNLPVSSETAKWWDAHKAHDAQREAQQRAREEQARVAGIARQKLTPEEIKALGIKS